MRTSAQLAVAAVAVLAVASCLPEDADRGADVARAVASAAPAASSPTPVREAASAPSPVAPSRPSPTRTRAAAPLLVAADGGDGDSWRDTAGREYRLGLVNTPEVGECFAAEATAKRRALVARGFRAAVYETDRYGRAVAVVTTPDGLNVNVHLARYGFADDRYLAGFRGENPSLAAQLDRAFAAARAERRGLWSACSGGSGQAQGIAAPPPAAAAPAAPAAGSDAGCHPDYATCVPVQGDGSGRGAANDLDCGDLSGAVRLRQAGVDPYRLDADGDGVGCDS